jgi:hypothetical protein
LTRSAEPTASLPTSIVTLIEAEKAFEVGLKF